ncbi:hypothetical protein HanXRQr2_Chr06g0268031 [Helianthus annuus]|uniref:Uncharacterized protein n=1 Tax=Helianthus annuus TaxID=4232 RepID=A0A251V7V5_HELAN|nr:hypothetical protein HanXRQr2_Chr06g0268031 [Helianthus annuus]KAJ0440037.1 hypothetical protein HanHA300_Chr16g0631991 [Helianthus annuus]KAJ0445310.1 hypothetical protein HanIR_Chr16g0841481 [Helianthus annuus]KAJ0462416.1 hypothetical protein HanHA89_Chr16g0683141 [Helianthus annuus]KAJ0631080.1 hypothetical protein HanLR1_Chr17g0650121 [Helianthus annuus]
MINKQTKKVKGLNLLKRIKVLIKTNKRKMENTKHTTGVFVGSIKKGEPRTNPNFQKFTRLGRN